MTGYRVRRRGPTEIEDGSRCNEMCPERKATVMAVKIGGSTEGDAGQEEMSNGKSQERSREKQTSSGSAWSQKPRFQGYFRQGKPHVASKEYGSGGFRATAIQKFNVSSFFSPPHDYNETWNDKVHQGEVAFGSRPGDPVL